jgi:hypothetical protein
VHVDPALGGPPVEPGIGLVGPQPLAGQHRRVVGEPVHQRRHPGAGEQVVVDVGEHADPVVAGHLGEGDRHVGPQRPVRQRAQQRLRVAGDGVGVGGQPAGRVGGGERPPAVLGEGDPGVAAVHRGVLLAGLAAGVPVVVEVGAGDVPAVPGGDRRQRRRATGARVDQRAEQVEGHPGHETMIASDG